MSESRSELLAWLNELLQINYTRVEQCGTGAAYCQILDSVYRMFPSQKRLLPPASVLCMMPTCVCACSGCADAARQNECETRVRVYSEFQSDAKCLQGEADRQGASTTSLPLAPLSSALPFPKRKHLLF